MKIYTKTGDKGETGMMGGKRVRKDAPRIQAQGDIDELNAALGVCRAHNGDEFLEGILHILQREIFILGADISTPTESHYKVPRIEERQITQLEMWIDRIDSEVKPLQHFILPGGSMGAANLHLARTVCRRAERSIVALSQTENINTFAVVYLNRLSDLLFMMARYANIIAGIEEEKWKAS